MRTVHLTGYTADQEQPAGLARAAYHDGRLSDPQPVNAGSEPSWVTTSADGQWVYAVGEGDPGEVRSVAAGGAGVTSRTGSGGAGPCHLAVGPHGTLVASNYDSGSVGLLRAAGGEVELVAELALEGSGPHERQDAPHAHQATFLTREEVVVCDLGSDRLAGLRVAGDRLEQRWEVAMPAGSGPRHLAASADRSTLWVVGELDCTLTPVRRDGAGWSVGDPVDARGPDAGQVGDHLGSGIVPGGSGRHLYVTVRGADLLAHLEVGADGTPTWQGAVATGHWPRFVGALPDGALVVTAQRDDLVQVVPLGPGGAPHTPVIGVSWPAPTCLTW